MSLPSDNSSYTVSNSSDLESNQYPKLTNTQRKRIESQERTYLTSFLMWFLINLGYEFDLRPVVKQSNYVDSIVIERICWVDKCTGEERVVFEFEKMVNSLRMDGVKEKDLYRKAVVGMNNALLDLCSYMGLRFETKKIRKGEESKKVTRKIVTRLMVASDGINLCWDRNAIFAQGKWFFEIFLIKINKCGRSFPTEEVKQWMAQLENMF